MLNTENAVNKCGKLHKESVVSKKLQFFFSSHTLWLQRVYRTESEAV